MSVFCDVVFSCENSIITTSLSWCQTPVHIAYLLITCTFCSCSSLYCLIFVYCFVTCSVIIAIIGVLCAVKRLQMLVKVFCLLLVYNQTCSTFEIGVFRVNVSYQRGCEKCHVLTVSVNRPSFSSVQRDSLTSCLHTYNVCYDYVCVSVTFACVCFVLTVFTIFVSIFVCYFLILKRSFLLSLHVV